MNKWFAKFSTRVSDVAGSSWAFFVAIGIIVIWAISGPVFGFSDTWQLVINTGTTIVTFLMVFLIQNTQNRDAKAIHLKLDEIIHVIGPAHDQLIDVEELSDEELRAILQAYRKVAQQKHEDGDAEINDLVHAAQDDSNSAETKELIAAAQEASGKRKASSNGKSDKESAKKEESGKKS